MLGAPLCKLSASYWRPKGAQSGENPPCSCFSLTLIVIVVTDQQAFLELIFSKFANELLAHRQPPGKLVNLNDTHTQREHYS